MQKLNLIILVISLLFFSACTNTGINGKTVLFYGNTCPHCQDLEESFAKFGVEEKFSFERKEVYENKSNANLMGVAAANCGLNPNRVGVPFLYAEDKCFMGVPDIQKYVSEKTGINFEASSSAQEASTAAKPELDQNQ